jgi:hypothetical protein
MSSRTSRTNRGVFYTNYAETGSSDPTIGAMYNKTFASLDDLESLLYSPVALRFHIGDPDIPSVLTEAKGRAASAKLRQTCRQSGADSLISQAVQQSLRKGAGLIKTLYKNKEFADYLVMPEDFGVLRENHTKLDQDMGAFCHTMMITLEQLESLVENRDDSAEVLKKARKLTKETTGDLYDTNGSAMNIVVCGLYPLQPAGAGINPSRGIVDWMSTPKPETSPDVIQTMLELKEIWIWDDDRDDWATFQLIGDDILVNGAIFFYNMLAFDPRSGVSAPCLKGVHPFTPFIVNPTPGYFWGASEVRLLILLQEMINTRLTGINKLLRKQEDPTTRFIGSTGVNQIALSRYNKPGGYYADTNPQAKIERDKIDVPQDLFESLHEAERMFDEIMGMPPISKGHGDKGVRSANHAEVLARMFSPRFKDRALLIERCVEEFGALRLDLSRAHIEKKMIAWVSKEEAGIEADASDEELQILKPPAPGLVPVYFTFDDLPDDVTLTVDEHSSSPAFSADAQNLAFDLLKVGAMSPSDLVEHVNAPNPDELQAGIQRREIAAAEAQQAELKVRLLHGGKAPGKHK